MATMTFLILIIIEFLVMIEYNGVQGSYNIAQGKNATASSVLKTVNYWTAEKAVDGNNSQDVNSNSCLHTQENASRHEEFLRVDLGGQYTINSVVVYFAKANNVKERSIRYLLMISNSTLTNGPYCYTDKTSTPAMFDLHQIQRCKGTGRYVSIVQKHKSNEGGRNGPILEICEFQVYGCPIGTYGTDCKRNCSAFCANKVCNPDNGTCTYGCVEDWSGTFCNEKNVAYHKKATSTSSIKPVWNAEKAVDGNINDNVYCNSCLHTTNKVGQPAYLTVDLGQVYTINRIEIYFVKYDASGCSYRNIVSTTVPGRSFGYSVILSNPHGNWTCYKDNTTRKEDFNFTQNPLCAGNTRTVTIYQPNSSKSETTIGPILEICELKVFGCRSGKFGKKCDKECPQNCVDKYCDPDTGACFNGCMSGWKGTNCDLACTNGTYGFNCNQSCGHCRNNATCDKITGVCPQSLCASGVTGLKCDQACNNGTYGFNCNQSCGHCQNKTSCDRITGLCPHSLCASGVTGLKCDQDCPNGTFGFNCTGICGNCRNTSVCQKNTGVCLSGLCARGYLRPYCSDACLNGTYGVNCSQNCGRCRNRAVCDPKSGNCPDNLCESGVNGTRCDQECPNGTFGYDCRGICGHCKGNSTCYKRNGTCPGGSCERGFHGSNCSKECTDGNYGYDCKKSCGQCRDKKICNKKTGICPNGLCVSGVNGSKCDKDCPDGTFGYDCKGNCGNCRNKTFCNKTTGACPFGQCERGYKGLNCTDECEDSNYGYNCNLSCGKCRSHKTCNKTTGDCPYGLCESGVNGSRCDQDCPDGTYGFDCNGICGKCLNGSSCNKKTGACPSSLCEEGFYQSNCSKECVNGFYGYNCRNNCGECGNDVVCDKTTGICPNGVCGRGVNGSKCDQVCANGTYGYNCNETCGHCKKDLFCDARYGNCSHSMCMWGFQGLKCDKMASQQTDSDNNTPVIAGGLGAVLLVAILVIVVLIFFKRHRMSGEKSSQNNVHEFSDFGTARTRESRESRENEQNSSGVYASAKKMNSYMDIKDIQAKDADDEEIEQEYVNVQLGKRPDKDYQMPCRTLADIVKEKENDENKIFKEEFGTLPKGQLKPCEAAKMPSNMPKNRFKTTFPYDDTRIVLKTDGAKESDYVNANYIKDTNGRCTYIASQGPRTHTVVDMWRMVWQEEISCIVMLTNLQEKRIDKCAKYWPNVTCTEIYGQISIKTIKENINGNYTIRVFKITNTQESESRDVSHYHYTTWPDHGVPESLDLVIFHNKVQRQALSSSKSGAPLLVHCSAGIGRTGTFIALDALLSHSKDNDSVNIFQFVKHMREEDRMNMIQTVDQYVAIHHLLLEAIRTKYYPIQKSSFAEEVKRMCSTSSPANQNVFRRQISELNDLKPNYSDDDFTRGLHNQDCNIDPNILPVDRYMLYLTTFVKGRNDYINAITVPIQTALHSIVVTSNPKDNTTVDLIRLILDHGSFVVDLSGSTNGQQWYPDPSTTRSYNPFEVERSELKTSNIANVTESDCTIFQKQKDSAPLSFRLFESKIWPSDVSDEDGLRALCGLVRRVMLWNRTSTNGKLILVSKDGVTRCDVFCAVYNALEQLEMDEEVDMFNIVRQLQIRRPQFIQTMEEYKLCFDAVSYDLESNNESIYANV